MGWTKKGFAAGDWVEIKPFDEILATLDPQGNYNNLPFMPEMREHCGKRFRVLKSAHKTCDTVNQTGGRRMYDSVHLDHLRCDGSQHGGCQAVCLIFWKYAWLRPVEGPAVETDSRNISGPTKSSEADYVDAMSAAGRNDNSVDPVFSCQATMLFDATSPLSRTRMSQYVADVQTRNVSFGRAVKILVLGAIFNLRYVGIGYNLSVRLYDLVHKLLHGRAAPRWAGSIPNEKATPDGRLELEVGDLVEVRSMEEILSTLNENGNNRGLSFDPEMVPYCGRRFRVAKRVEKIINEKTGTMMHFSNPCIVLDGVFCQGEYSALRLMCPRQITPYWRELWLRRVDESPE